MKIAYVLNTYPMPSQSFIRREIRALERQGVSVSRIAMRRSPVALVDPMDHAEEAATTYVLERGAVALIWSTLTCALFHPGRFLAALRLALQLARASETGILRHLIYLAEACSVRRLCNVGGVEHAHAHFGTNATAVTMLAQALGGPGYSFTVHGPEEFDSPRGLSLGTKLDRSRFAIGVSWFGRSQLQRWAAIETWPRLHVVHCGIEPERFADPAPIPDKALRLVTIGRFSEQKGQLVLIEALDIVRQRVPDAQLVLVGEGELGPRLRQEVSRRGLDAHVTFAGWLDEQGVRAELDASTALVMPSFAEGLPMVIMEAMAAGRPVISTYVAGIPELVLPGETGWLVPAGDAAALAAAIAELADTPGPLLTQMAENGRARALARHDADTEAARLRTLFESDRES